MGRLTELPMGRVRWIANEFLDAAPNVPGPSGTEIITLARMVLALTEERISVGGEGTAFAWPDLVAVLRADIATLTAQRDEAVAVAREAVERACIGPNCPNPQCQDLRARLAALTTPTGGTDG